MNTITTDFILPPPHFDNSSCLLQLHNDNVEEENILKRCKWCDCEKVLNEFSVLKAGKFGRHSQCKECKQKSSKKRYGMLKNRNPDDITYPKTKKCPDCQTTKSSEDFHINHTVKDGLHSVCKVCNSGRVSLYNSTRKDDVNRRSRESKKRYPEKRCFETSKRRALKKSATHPKINHQKVKELYKKSKELTVSTGISHHVDHIFPLSMAPNCKIHHEDNLQIIKGYINLDKNDKLTYVNPDIKHWSELPYHILSEISPEILKNAWKEWNDYCNDQVYDNNFSGKLSSILFPSLTAEEKVYPFDIDIISKETVYDMNKNDNSIYGNYY